LLRIVNHVIIYSPELVSPIFYNDVGVVGYMLHLHCSTYVSSANYLKACGMAPEKLIWTLVLILIPVPFQCQVCQRLIELDQEIQLIIVLINPASLRAARVELVKASN